MCMYTESNWDTYPSDGGLGCPMTTQMKKWQHKTVVSYNPVTRELFKWRESWQKGKKS